MSIGCLLINRKTLYFELNTYQACWAAVVAQLAEWSLLTPEIPGSNPNIVKNLSVNCII